MEMNPLHLPELTFDDGPHIYRLDGVEIPSVTSLMEPLSRSEYAKIDAHTLERAAKRGTSVHFAIENWLKFGIDDSEPEFHGYMDAFLDWYEKFNPEIIGSEVRVYHKLFRYAGTIDILAKIGGKVTLIDTKTTSRLIEKNCRVQTEGYAQACSSHGFAIEDKHILLLNAKGQWKYPQYPAKDAEAWRVMTSLKTIYDFQKS